MRVQFNNELRDWARSVVQEAGGLSLRQVEIRTGVSFTTIQNILNGRVPEPTILIRFASAFKQDVGAALRLAGHVDMADLWETGAYKPDLEATPADDEDYDGDDATYGEVIRKRQEIGRRIKARMDTLNWQQSDLARVLGKSQGTVSGYIKGRIALDAVDLARIATALKVPVGSLFGEDEPSDEGADGNCPRLVAFYDDLTSDGQEDLIAIAEAVWRRKRRQDPVIGRKAE